VRFAILMPTNCSRSRMPAHIAGSYFTSNVAIQISADVVATLK